ncbi:disulfide bond chaperone [Puniceicoccales bacterium CK1056]|uniref:Disulfide bond chaperone n=1 Tax=Oceanipulchritudo coccoides TaxID=2706888 RepID=A0A6B2LXG3_9BACT|nr:Hsp33 family molecular chaperone HslO [Oceanipulchritudo coccoides]NDV61271.1 disulfide bond chaperone [Oceanipulchritudo coccoides]
MSSEKGNQPASEPEGCLIENRFVRGRNVLVASADFSGLFVDYFLHLQHHGIQVTRENAEYFKDFFAGFTLHAASHPRNEVLAWTVHFQDPHLNIFLAGDTELSTVTGRIFTDGLKEEETNMFYQDLVVRGKPPHRSIVPFEGADPKATIEFYYSQSEQRPGRFFHLGEDRYALVTAHPDWDESWFKNLDQKTVQSLQDTETVSLLETRRYGWSCGCNYDRILEILKSPMQADPEGLFGEEEAITINCPRCAGRYRISREAMEAYLADTSEKTT